ncbi:MAG: hypothetical protein PVF27_05460, partial [Gemmatimonadales bacterium]
MMKRREFVRTAGGAVLSVVLPNVGAGACAPRSSRPFNWVWVHGGRERPRGEWQRQFARLAGAGIRGVLVGGGDTEMLSSAARDEGLQFHRWTWVLNRSGDTWVKEHHPEWFTVARTGASSLVAPPYLGYYQWLCPTREAVRDYLRG